MHFFINDTCSRDIMVEEPIGKDLLTSFILFDSLYGSSSTVKAGLKAMVKQDFLDLQILARSETCWDSWIEFLYESTFLFLRISIWPNHLTEALLFFLFYWKWFFHTKYSDYNLPFPISFQSLPISLLTVLLRSHSFQLDDKQKNKTRMKNKENTHETYMHLHTNA